MPTVPKPGFDPKAAKEIMEQQREAAEAQRRGDMALARRYSRDRDYVQERKAVYDLYLQGYESHEIKDRAADVLGRTLTLQRVDALIKSAIHDQKRYTTEERRAIENARMDLYLVMLNDRIKMGDDKAIGRAIEISKRRSALNGLDAPVKVQANITADVDPAILALAEQARADASEAIRNRYPQGIEDATIVDDEEGSPDLDFAGELPEDEL